MKVSNTQSILGLIRLAGRAPKNHRRLILSAAFISANFLCAKLGRSVTQVPTVIITRPDTIPLILQELKTWRGLLALGSVANLHAKVYLACGRDERDSVALVGSFNLTAAALNTNVEIGIRFAATRMDARKPSECLRLN